MFLGNHNLPPLRTHMHDLEALVAYVLEKLCDATNRAAPRLSSALWERLHRHDWPGNVRELRMGLETALEMTGGELLGVEDMPCIARPRQRVQPTAASPATRASAAPAPPLSAAGIDIPTALEARMILRTLAQNEWDKSATARQIGWSRQKLYRAMKRYGIPNRVTDEQVRALAECIQTLTASIDAPPVNTTRQ